MQPTEIAIFQPIKPEAAMGSAVNGYNGHFLLIIIINIKCLLLLIPDFPVPLWFYSGRALSYRLF